MNEISDITSSMDRNASLEVRRRRFEEALFLLLLVLLPFFFFEDVVIFDGVGGLNDSL